MAIKISKQDKVFSQCIRERANWTCERCGKYYPEGNRQGLDASHLFGRRHSSTRWNPDNVFAHCRGCHQYLGSNPPIFTAWARDKLGDVRYDWLMERHNQTVKYTKADKEEMYQHYKAQLAYMQRLRKEGDTGYLPLCGWD